MTAAARPKVTICIPTIGRLMYMEQTLESLRAQSLPDYELLILYNGADNAIQERLKGFAEKHRNARVIADPAPMPMFANFNRGLQAALGEYVAFFHDDDVYEPNFLARTTSLLDSNPGAAFAGSNYYIIDSDNRVEGHRRLIKKTGAQRGHDFIRELIHRGRGAVPTPGIVFRKSSFDARGWDEKLSMHFGDFVVLMRMAETQDAILIAEPLMRVRLHERNASNVPMSIAAPMLHNAFSAYIDEFLERWPLLGDFAHNLRNSARTALVRSLVWGWLSAQNEGEAARCTDLLRGQRANLYARVLDVMSALGFRTGRRKSIAGIVRRIGRVAG